MHQAKQNKTIHQLAIFSLIALIILDVCWELFLANGGIASLWALKAVPLLFPLRGVIRGDVYTMQWSSMFILFYFIEGVVRAMGDATLLSRSLASAEIVLSLAFFVATVLFVRPYKQIAKASRLNEALTKAQK